MAARAPRSSMSIDMVTLSPKTNYPVRGDLGPVGIITSTKYFRAERPRNEDEREYWRQGSIMTGGAGVLVINWSPTTGFEHGKAEAVHVAGEEEKEASPEKKSKKQKKGGGYGPVAPQGEEEAAALKRHSDRQCLSDKSLLAIIIICHIAAVGALVVVNAFVFDVFISESLPDGMHNVSSVHLVNGTGFYFYEKASDQRGWTMLDSAFLVVTSLAGDGFGSVVPSTQEGKALTVRSGWTQARGGPVTCLTHTRDGACLARR